MTRTSTARPVPAAAIAALLVSALGCVGSIGDDVGSNTDAVPTIGGSGGAAGAAVGSAGGGVGGGSGACAPATTHPCECMSGIGVRRCAPDASGWSTCECSVYGAEIAVSPFGDDTNLGTTDAPFRTPGRAQQAVRALVAAGLPEGGVVVWLRAGSYDLDDTLALGPEDSGDAKRPVAWRGYPGETARLRGGVTIPAASFTSISSSSPIYERLDPSARAAVLEVSLPSAGVTSYGQLTRRGFCSEAAVGPLEIFVSGAPMTLARWPDAADTTIPTNIETSDALDVYGAPSPDVTGHYIKNGVQDGVSSFTREGLVNGLTYHLYRSTWNYQNADYTAWFLTTDASGYPSGALPWFYRYSESLGPMQPSNGASGLPTTRDPKAINHGFASILEALSDTQWRYAGDRPSRWAGASDVWFEGFWKYAWADCHATAAKIDASTQTITLSQVPTLGIAKAQPYYAYNIPEEITVPGEYWVDRTTGMLYLWPPDGFAQAEAVVSILEKPLVAMTAATSIELLDLTLEAGRADLVRIDGGEGCSLVGLTLRDAGANAGTISGKNHVVRSCHVHDTGNGGLSVSGGDRPSLTAAGNVVENSHFHDMSRWEMTYRPAVRLQGSGSAARHNLIHDLPHAAILYDGNEHLIELNAIHDVAKFSSDVGAIYAGRDWGARGNVIRHNFIHHLSTWFDGAGVQGIYLDDCLSGIRVEGNVLYAISGSGIQHGGGRDDIIVNNIVARSGMLLKADSRGVEWQPNYPNDIPGDSFNLLEKLNAVGYQSEPWASKYPECAAIPNDWNTIVAPGSGWLLPQGCVLSQNIGFANGTWADATPGTLEAYAAIGDNLENVDPLFVDEDALDLRLQPASPAYGIPGWEEIPFASIGIQP